MEVVQEALEGIGHHVGEPIDHQQDEDKGDDAGILGFGDPAREDLPQPQVGIGGGHHSRGQPHQPRQFLEQAPIISPDDNQPQKDQDPQVQEVHGRHLFHEMNRTYQKNREPSTLWEYRHNLTMRMSMRRFTRLTNAFSKKVENLTHAVSLHFMYYNFARIHQSLRVTPAMEAGVADHVWTLEEIAALAD